MKGLPVNLNMNGHIHTIIEVTDIMPATSIMYKNQKFLTFYNDDAEFNLKLKRRAGCR